MELNRCDSWTSSHIAKQLHLHSLIRLYSHISNYNVHRFIADVDILCICGLNCRSIHPRYRDPSSVALLQVSSFPYKAFKVFLTHVKRIWREQIVKPSVTRFGNWTQMQRTWAEFKVKSYLLKSGPVHRLWEVMVQSTADSSRLKF